MNIPRPRYVEWDVPVRIRHYASGKYLAVLRNTAPEARSHGEQWYETHLVDDSKLTHLQGHEKRDPAQWNLADHRDTVFHIVSTESTDNEALPSASAWSIRLEFHMSDTPGLNEPLNGPLDGTAGAANAGGGTGVGGASSGGAGGSGGGAGGTGVVGIAKPQTKKVLYFHNTELTKPQQQHKADKDTQDAEFARPSNRICFSTLWSNQNILKAMPADGTEVICLGRLRGGAEKHRLFKNSRCNRK